MKTPNMMIIEELARARYDALMNDKNTHKSFIEFIYNCLKSEIDSRPLEVGEDRINPVDGVNYLIFEEFPILGITVKDFMCRFDYDSCGQRVYPNVLVSLCKKS